MSVEELLALNEKYPNHQKLIIGGEPMLLSPEYYLELLDSGMEFSMQTNLTLYTEHWNQVLNHPNFLGLSVSGDKFKDFETFYQTFEKITENLGHSPLVLVLMDLDMLKSYKKAKDWYAYAKEYRFPMKLNYLLPTGKAQENIERVMKLSEVFNVYLHMFHQWLRDSREVELQPFQDLYEHLAGRKGSVCPFIESCIREDVMVDVEMDGQEYPCPVLGDLKLQKEDLKIEFVDECLLCEHFELCKGCNIRNWMLQQIEDPGYCASAKEFFKCLKEAVKLERESHVVEG